MFLMQSEFNHTAKVNEIYLKISSRESWIWDFSAVLTEIGIILAGISLPATLFYNGPWKLYVLFINFKLVPFSTT